MLDFLKSFFDENKKAIKRYEKKLLKINEWEDRLASLADEELQAKTKEFKKRYQTGETLDDLMAEAFAVIREASKRVLSMRHYDVQMIGGMVLHEGRIAEMKTGEGKTLVATAPVYLNAIAGKGVHVITVNDYLAARDSQWMGELYGFLGLSVGLVVHGMDFAAKKEAYACDITYGTNNEFGFDYLRDNMAVRPEHMVQRDLNYAIVDEVDSILIDEARTPLIISGPADKPTELYYSIAKVIPRLQKDEDYEVDEKANNVVLTEAGISKVEKYLGLENLYADENTELSHHVSQGLKAHVLFKKDKDYVVKDGQVIIVDEFTGRLMFGRRYSEGLHQAIEAKEQVKIERESQTLATITFQNYFRMYDKLAGMTGTAITEEDEFRKIYGLDVLVIPTNKPLQREDFSDVVYRTEKGKFDAIVNEIAEHHKKGQPILVGTISIEKSEELSNSLRKKGIEHQVLNAKFHEKEAEIVAQAGQYNGVTIATNMAGRGTDILLGGNPEMLAKKTVDPKDDQEKFKNALAESEIEVKAEKEKVLQAGGLYIIGTERHESRRIDNQLRGRSGRQGDPGASKFFISMEDDLMRLFGSENLGNIMDKLGVDDTVPIDHPLISKSIERAQKKVEARNFDIRKHVLDYDDVMNQQREVIYAQRRQVLIGDDLRKIILDMFESVIAGTVEHFSRESVHPEEWDIPAFLEEIKLFLPEHQYQESDIKKLSKEEILENLQKESLQAYQDRCQELGEETIKDLERIVVLKSVDGKWMDHLDAMDQLRQGIGLRAYGQRDPLVEYKYEAYRMFEEMIYDIQTDVVRLLMRVKVMEAPKERQNLVENKAGEAEQKKKTVRNEQKIGRNDPCPCGSGKKYKKCCGKK